MIVPMPVAIATRRALAVTAALVGPAMPVISFSKRRRYRQTAY
jgi:hypothetical protein